MDTNPNRPPATYSPEEIAQWRASLFAASVETSMEADRSIVSISAAGVGLMVTLIATQESASLWLVVLAAAALLSFGVAIVAGTEIFRKNNEYLQILAHNPSADRPAELGRLEGLLTWSFRVGLLSSAFAGLTVFALAGW